MNRMLSCRVGFLLIKHTVTKKQTHATLTTLCLINKVKLYCYNCHLWCWFGCLSTRTHCAPFKVCLWVGSCVWIVTPEGVFAVPHLYSVLSQCLLYSFIEVGQTLHHMTTLLKKRFNVLLPERHFVSLQMKRLMSAISPNCAFVARWCCVCVLSLWHTYCNKTTVPFPSLIVFPLRKESVQIVV